MSTPLAAITQLIARLRIRSEKGAALVEYALLVALIAVVCIAAVTFLGSNASSTFSGVGTSINP
jgi:pilus assembly protein Flp/PilA